MIFLQPPFYALCYFRFAPLGVPLSLRRNTKLSEQFFLSLFYLLEWSLHFPRCLPGDLLEDPIEISLGIKAAGGGDFGNR